MSIYKNSEKLFMTKGSFKPASLFKGETHLCGAKDETFDGRTITVSNSYNYKPTRIQINGGHPSKNLFSLDKFLALTNNYKYYKKDEDNNLVQVIQDYRQYRIVPPYIELPPGTYTVSLHGVTKDLWLVCVYDAVVTDTFTLTETTSVKIKSFYPADTVVGKFQLEKGDTATEYEEYIEPYEPTLIWNGEEIHIPYILRECDYICCEGDKVEYFNFYTSTLEDITDTSLGQKLLSLTTVHPEFSASISYGSLSVTAKTNK